ncbi:MAG: hypothetical protein E6G41_09405 [Actinobacteria bacterium]|nr:MAG: hypothetical protein E6G41_09405 [Actinomycetota bacterium]
MPAFGVLLVAAESIWVLASLFLAAMTCDEGCDPASVLWRDNPDAWQWHAFPIVSGIGLLCTITAVTFALRDKPRDAVVSFGLSVAAMVVWGVIYSSGF